MKKPDDNTGIVFEAFKKPGSRQPDFKGEVVVLKPGLYKMVGWRGFTKIDKKEYISFRLEHFVENPDTAK